MAPPNANLLGTTSLGITTTATLASGFGAGGAAAPLTLEIHGQKTLQIHAGLVGGAVHETDDVIDVQGVVDLAPLGATDKLRVTKDTGATENVVLTTVAGGDLIIGQAGQTVSFPGTVSQTGETKTRTLAASEAGFSAGASQPVLVGGREDPKNIAWQVKNADTVAQLVAPIVTPPYLNVDIRDNDRAIDFGETFAISRDGSTLAVGAQEAYVDGISDVGIVFVYEQELEDPEIGSWEVGRWQYKAHLIPDNPAQYGGGDDFQLGKSIQISDDGATVMVMPSDSHDGSYAGVYFTALMFERGSTSWGDVPGARTESSKVLMVEDAPTLGGRAFEDGMAKLSGDGSTIVGLWEDGYSAGRGKAVVVERPGASWTGTVDKAADIVIPESATNGTSDTYDRAAISANGDTVVLCNYAGNNGDAINHGMVYVIERGGANWSGTVTDWNAKYTREAGETKTNNPSVYLGEFLQLSGDGSRLLITAHQSDTRGSNYGNAYVLDRPGGTWGASTSPTAIPLSNANSRRLIGSGVTNQLGYQSAMSLDGSRVYLATSPKMQETYVYDIPGATWGTGDQAEAAMFDFRDQGDFDESRTAENLALAGTDTFVVRADLGLPVIGDESVHTLRYGRYTSLKRVTAPYAEAEFSLKTENVYSHNYAGGRLTGLVLDVGYTYTLDVSDPSVANLVISSSPSQLLAGNYSSGVQFNGGAPAGSSAGNAGDVYTIDTTAQSGGDFYIGEAGSTVPLHAKVTPAAITKALEHDVSGVGIRVDAISYDYNDEVFDAEKSILWKNNEKGTRGSGDDAAAWCISGGHLQLSRKISAHQHVHPFGQETDGEETTVTYQFRIGNDESLRVVKLEGWGKGSSPLNGRDSVNIVEFGVV